MKFNFIIIPLVIAVTAYLGSRYTKKGLKTWYPSLKKPDWTPSGQTIGEIWTFLYISCGFAVMWFWNVPRFSFWHYIIGAILLINAFMNMYWNKIFFVDHNFNKAIKWMQVMNVTTLIAGAMIGFFAAISAILFLPYIIWVAIATNLTKQIKQLNN